MIVFVEGVDGSGKTTLCRELAQKGYTVRKCIDREEPLQFGSWYNVVKNNRAEQIIIFDRSLLSEVVYRLFDNKEPCLELYDMLQLFCLTEVKLILCENGQSFENSIKRGELNITVKELSEQIQNTYRIFYNVIKKFTNWECFVYDWEVQNVSDVINFIEGGKKNAV